MGAGILFNFAEGVVGELSSALISATLKKNGLVYGVHDDLRKLKNTASRIQAVLLDAEEKQVENHQLKDWLEKLEHVFYAIDDLVLMQWDQS
ncbi:hypothetical protein PanWU01x14_284250 [Parasponia andersonii]|uniref:Disease resistance N-terminal domain-containing protein n=1 Tax=Parasponia andersonii TaxID=3476 RepID=A0A2P5AZZ4_PARAD|nr:hypothetical protein PanWU01x14_284250 [Parasponia andersonii]